LRVLRRIFVPKRNEVTREWRKLHKEKLRDLCPSPITCRIVEGNEVGRACSTNWRRGTRLEYWQEIQRERDH
jgi:hypothetical protein